MSSKKKLTTEPPAMVIAETELSAEKMSNGRTDEPDYSADKEKDGKAGADGAGFCVYIGPTIIGQIQSGTVYPGSREQVLARADMADLLQKYPLVANLLVNGDQLPEARLRVKSPGNLLYINYHKLAKAGK